MKSFYDKYKFDTYSQNGEDGIIQECLKRIHATGIDTTKFVCVEFGAADGKYCSNTALLAEAGLPSFMFDINPPPGSDVMKAEITPENINAYIPQCNVLSIDIDGNDYNVWKAYDGKPDIVVIEINSSYNPYVSLPVSDLQHGTCYRSMVKLALSKGYFLIAHTGNLVFLLDKHRALFPEMVGDGLANPDDYFQTK